MKKTRGGGADAERRRSSTRLKVRAQTGRFGDVKGRRSCFNLSPPRACVIFITRTSCSLWLLHVAARLGRVDDVSQSVLSTPVVVVVDWPCADHSSHLFSVCTRRQLGDNPRPSNQWTCERSQSHSDSEKVVRLNWHPSVWRFFSRAISTFYVDSLNDEAVVISLLTALLCVVFELRK